MTNIAKTEAILRENGVEPRSDVNTPRQAENAFFDWNPNDHCGLDLDVITHESPLNDYYGSFAPWPVIDEPSIRSHELSRDDFGLRHLPHEMPGHEGGAVREPMCSDVAMFLLFGHPEGYVGFEGDNGQSTLRKLLDGQTPTLVLLDEMDIKADDK